MGKRIRKQCPDQHVTKKEDAAVVSPPKNPRPGLPPWYEPRWGAESRRLLRNAEASLRAMVDYTHYAPLTEKVSDLSVVKLKAMASEGSVNLRL